MVVVAYKNKSIVTVKYRTKSAKLLRFSPDIILFLTLVTIVIVKLKQGWPQAWINSIHKYFPTFVILNYYIKSLKITSKLAIFHLYFKKFSGVDP